MINVNYKQLDESQCTFYAIVPAEDLPNGERLFLQIDDRPIVIFNIAGDFYAIGDVCTHDEGPLGEGEIEGWEIVCPRHGAHFDIRTGQAVVLPAVVDTPAYPVRVVNGQIEIGIPNE
jgi:3-phenylpropionate/trans-cinnamate dioxygenase ferredoxin subunit